MFDPPPRALALGVTLTVSLIANVALILPLGGGVPAAEAVDFSPETLSLVKPACPQAKMVCSGEGREMKCECDGRPLGAGTSKIMPNYYPYGNSSLATIYDTQAFMKDELLPLSQFKAKAILIGNTASN